MTDEDLELATVHLLTRLYEPDEVVRIMGSDEWSGWLWEAAELTGFPG
jgi:hypothetical protein